MLSVVLRNTSTNFTHNVHWLAFAMPTLDVVVVWQKVNEKTSFFSFLPEILESRSLRSQFRRRRRSAASQPLRERPQKLILKERERKRERDGKGDGVKNIVSSLHSFTFFPFLIVSSTLKNVSM